MITGEETNILNTSTFHILTYGCQMNVRDSENISSMLIACGYQEAPLTEAELIVLNTCSVRHSAENKVFGKIGNLQTLRKDRPGLIIALGGCMAEIPENVEYLKKLHVDIVFGMQQVGELPTLIQNFKEKRKPIVWVAKEKDFSVREFSFPDLRVQKTCAYVNVMYGCDNFCSYCIVPYTRGRERSRTPEAILQETRDLGERGFKEITYLGQNVNSYGKNLKPTFDFSDLLRQANAIESVSRLRFTTSHPKDLNEKLMKTIADCDKVCEYFHVAMQAGSNRILRMMNRGYTRERFLEQVEKLRQIIPGIALGTDVIVGFPGETETEFMDTVDLMQQVAFDQAYIFMYSPRSGTKASNYIDSVPPEVKKERIRYLQDIQYAIAKKINLSLEQTVQEVLVEGSSKNNPAMLTGRTRTNRIVIFQGEKELIGELVTVNIDSSNTFSLFGSLCLSP